MRNKALFIMVEKVLCTWLLVRDLGGGLLATGAENPPPRSLTRGPAAIFLSQKTQLTLFGITMVCFHPVIILWYHYFILGISKTHISVSVEMAEMVSLVRFSSQVRFNWVEISELDL